MVVGTLSKSDKLLSQVPDLMQNDFLLIRTRSIKDGGATLKQVVSLNKFSKQKVFDKFIIFLFSGIISLLKIP